jgi:adenosylcobinamide kinase / adenosylcobinamide-phosphate guanylyltransferase
LGCFGRLGIFAVAPILLVTGPARSGKSLWAESLANQSPQVIYMATAQRDDEDSDWSDRILAHRVRRPSHWQTQEVPLELPGAIAQAPAEACLLIDSLGSWLANCLGDSEADWQTRCDSLATALAATPARTILVAEETGWGVVPAYPLGRLFRDRLGSLIQQVAGVAQETYLVAGGHALPLHRLGIPLA